MRKRIRPDDRFVRLDNHTRVAADHVAGAVNLRRDDFRAQVIDVTTHVQRHDDLFQAGVSGSFTDAVDGHFHLPTAIDQTGKRVGCRQAQIIVTVYAKDDVLGAGSIRP